MYLFECLIKNNVKIVFKSHHYHHYIKIKLLIR